MESKNEWKEAFNQSKPLITYAIISGLTLTNIADALHELSQGNDPCEINVEQTVLDRIPRQDRPDYEFPATAPIFVEGHKILKDIAPTPKTYPLVLTNTEGGRRYGIALVFYEDLRDYIKIINEALPYKYSNEIEQQEMNEFVKENDEEAESNLMTIQEHERESSSVVAEGILKTMNVFDKIYKYVSSFTDEDLAQEKVFDGSNYYVPKSIILISESPIFETIEQIVRHIYFMNYPIELYLSYITHCAPLTPIGYAIEYSLPNLDKFIIRNNMLNQLPAVATSFYAEFFTKQMLSLNNFYDLLYWFMCQLGSTVFISNDANKIVMSTEVLRTVMFPFDYDEAYIPFLPSGLINYLEAPFAVLMGVVVYDEAQLLEIYEIASDKTMFVLLDEDQVSIKLDNCIISMKDFRK